MDHPGGDGVGDADLLVGIRGADVDGLALGVFDAGDEGSGGGADAGVGESGVGEAEVAHGDLTAAEEHGGLGGEAFEAGAFGEVPDFFRPGFDADPGGAIVFAFDQREAD